MLVAILTMLCCRTCNYASPFKLPYRTNKHFISWHICIYLTIFNHQYFSNETLAGPYTCPASDLGLSLNKSTKFLPLIRKHFLNLRQIRVTVTGGIVQSVPRTATISDVQYYASPSELSSSLNHPPELSSKYQQRHLVVKQNRAWQEMSVNFANEVSLSHSLTCCNILRHGADGFTSRPKEVVLPIFISLKNTLSSAGFKPAKLGSNGKHNKELDHRGRLQCRQHCHKQNLRDRLYKLLHVKLKVKGWQVGTLFYDAFSVTRLYSVDERMISEWWWLGKD
jgi:hypothetical protein